MADRRRLWLAAAGIGGAASVILAAASAHLAASGAQPNIDLASRFLMFHALALIGIATLTRAYDGRWLTFAGSLFIIGTLCFSGGLCLAALVDHALVPLVPVGGTILILGWIALIVAGFTIRGRRE
ncbi:MAG TPA: DUF423 domain-containing protein [Magnetospirillaceae bacterium]|jgi:uncharacterized membrane protein YgdD (TMEM256/DUF423 family)